ncbi:heavy-metal-associated domain-containing protein [Candidatus Pacearchaeota archaeon]|nr:heavy-metal-associated domain-containing protein [Candidatus Pacearchaeota archaeon]
MKKATLYINGMHCASCASNIERSISKIPGTKNQRVNLIAKKGFVDCEDNIKEDDLKNAVKRAGYQAIKVEFS